MPCNGERVTVSLDTSQGGGHDRGRRQRREWEGSTAGAGTVAHRSAAAGSQRPRARSRPVARRHRAAKRRWSKHTHPGEEIICILEGPLEYQIEGQPPMTVNAGDALTVPGGGGLRGEKCRPRQRGRTRHLRRRKGEAAPHAGRVTRVCPARQSFTRPHPAEGGKESSRRRTP